MNNKPNLKKVSLCIMIIVMSLIIVFSIIFIINKNISDKQDNEILEENKTNDVELPKEKNRFEDLTLTNENVGVTVLYYHAVDPAHPGEELYVSPTQLKEQLQLIKDLGYTSLTMTEVNDYIKNNKAIPEKSILITFDDGYTDNYTYAFPILKELNMKATIFVITSETDIGNYYVSSSQIKEMSDYGIDIESHTVSHLHLDTLSYEEQLEELKSSKSKIESITKKDVLSVAYPYGDYNEDTKKATIASGYSIAFTTDTGLADRTDNPVTLDRIYVNSLHSIDTFKDRLLGIQN
ncbi:polysaccharide deacetylase family protein [Clostridium vincentii]|uniref:Poly-beta-1,6-N-acetyl-D-glucosamine N-deacetylase n=1 Tax=Clostridium vincentii TaxID=52704 RepID=A0A2T0BFQ7_9CLOT|nr:polysaccharide deacetylase family protein [Clostridium vincentii]PRR82704.1 Poly-beta-1,6-N-acetyl-D-glucosamine N-deacetylase precursor [Clostridium vincentii]